MKKRARPLVDSAGQPFVDIPTVKGEHVRATLVAAVRAGPRVDSVRFQIRNAKGRLRQGPDVPLDLLGDLFAAAIKLVRAR